MRVSVSLTDEMVIKVDEEASKRGITRSDLVANAIQEYIIGIQTGLKVNQALETSLKAKDEEISFLRSHISQLTQSISTLSLPPSKEEVDAKLDELKQSIKQLSEEEAKKNEEEAKKKGWWQFWK